MPYTCGHTFLNNCLGLIYIIWLLGLTFDRKSSVYGGVMTAWGSSSKKVVTLVLLWAQTPIGWYRMTADWLRNTAVPNGTKRAKQKTFSTNGTDHTFAPNMGPCSIIYLYRNKYKIPLYILYYLFVIRESWLQPFTRGFRNGHIHLFIGASTL